MRSTRQATCPKARCITAKRKTVSVNHISFTNRCSCRSFCRYHCRCTPNLPRRSHSLAGRSNRRCADGHTPPLSFCTGFCSKGKAGPESEPTPKRPGALPPSHKNKSPHSKGKAGLEPSTTLRLQDALPAPHKHKPPHSKGKAVFEPSTTLRLQVAHPSPHHNKYSHPKGTAGL